MTVSFLDFLFSLGADWATIQSDRSYIIDENDNDRLPDEFTRKTLPQLKYFIQVSTILEDDEEAEEEEKQDTLHPSDIESIKREIADLCVFRDLAAKIKKNSKAEQLFTALDKGFEQLESLGASKKGSPA